MNEIYTLISELGFPIVVTFFLLSRIESKLDQVISSINNLSEKSIHE